MWGGCVRAVCVEKAQAQPDFLTVVNLNTCVPANHPLRAIKRRVDAVLQKLSPLFDDLYADDGRDSIPPRTTITSGHICEVMTTYEENAVKRLDRSQASR